MIAVGMGLSLTVHAQEVKKINPFTVEVLDQLNATEEQKQQVENLTKEHKAKLAELRKNKALSDEERLAEHRKINGERSKRLYNEILTPEQSRTLREMIREQRKQSQN